LYLFDAQETICYSEKEYNVLVSIKANPSSDPVAENE